MSIQFKQASYEAYKRGFSLMRSFDGERYIYQFYPGGLSEGNKVARKTVKGILSEIKKFPILTVDKNRIVAGKKLYHMGNGLYCEWSS